MSDEVEPRPAADSYTLLLIGKVDAALSPIDFNREYDEAVDELEDKLIKETFRAMERIDIDTAMEKLYQTRDLRKKYLDLLERSAKDPAHPLSPTGHSQMHRGPHPRPHRRLPYPPRPLRK